MVAVDQKKIDGRVHWERRSGEVLDPDGLWPGPRKRAVGSARRKFRLDSGKME